MKRFDLVAVSALMLLGAFVTREALGIRARADRERNASFGVARVDASTPRNDSVVVLRRPEVAAPVSGPVALSAPEVLRRLESTTKETYIHDVIESHDSAVARWPSRPDKPLRVWVQPSTPHPDFDSGNVSVVRQAFVEWSNLGLPVPFTFVQDSAMADVRVTWVNRFNESISGKTLWAHDDAYWIIDANIQLAVHHHSGEVLDPTSIRAIAMHEVGHLLGLDHTRDTTSIMAPKVRVRDLSAADRATAQLLYKLPAGKIQ